MKSTKPDTLFALQLNQWDPTDLIIICPADFICPTESTRQEFGADYTIWMDTIKEGRFDDMNKMFEAPSNYDFKVGHMEADMWSFLIKQDILDKHGNLGPHR